jgi:hypothetical protein
VEEYLMAQNDVYKMPLSEKKGFRMFILCLKMSSSGPHNSPKGHTLLSGYNEEAEAQRG